MSASIGCTGSRSPSSATGSSAAGSRSATSSSNRPAWCTAASTRRWPRAWPPTGPRRRVRRRQHRHGAVQPDELPATDHRRHDHAVARARHRGRTTWVWEVELTDDDGRLCVLTRVTVAVRPRAQRRVQAGSVSAGSALRRAAPQPELRERPQRRIGGGVDPQHVRPGQRDHARGTRPVGEDHAPAGGGQGGSERRARARRPARPGRPGAAGCRTSSRRRRPGAPAAAGRRSAGRRCVVTGCGMCGPLVGGSES